MKNCDDYIRFYNAFSGKSSSESGMQWVDMAAIVAGAREAMAEGVPEVATAVADLAVADLAEATVEVDLGVGVQAAAIAAGAPTPQGLRDNTKLLRVAIEQPTVIRPRTKPLRHGAHVELLRHMAILERKPLQLREHTERHSLTAGQRARQKQRLEVQ